MFSKVSKSLLVFSLLLAMKHVHAEQQEEVYPVAIIGGGVGALTSAIYLERAGVHSLVIEGKTPGGAIAQSPNVHNWPGELEIDGMALIEKIRNQAKVNGTNLLDEEVIGVDFSSRPYHITTRFVKNPEKTRTIQATTCIIAMGSTPRMLGVPGESLYWTHGVYSCAVCDGALFKNKKVAVIGGGDSAILEAEYLSKIASEVTIVLRSKNFRTTEVLRKNQILNKPNVRVVYDNKITEVEGDGKKATGLVLKTADGRSSKLAVDGIFLAIGSTPNSQLFKGQLDLDEKGFILLKDQQQTSKPGIFAIGDIVDPIYKQAISAAGDGAKAALQAERYLSAIAPVKESQADSAVALKIADKVSVGLQEITSIDDLNKELMNPTVPIIIDFYSPYCGPCRRLGPILEEKARQYQGQIKFFKVNISELSELATDYNIHGIPTILVFDSQGKQVDRRTGLDEINPLINNLDSLK